MDQIRLAPVDTVTITTLVDNVIDVFMPGQHNVTRFTDGSSPEQRSASTLEGGEVAEHPRTEHGFSALVEVCTADRKSVLLFDAGRTPDGLAHNIKVLGVDPTGIEAVVLSHGHFDHTTGLDGFTRRLGTANLPVIIHPNFWSRRRVTFPGREPWELPSTSKSALEAVGFDILEHRQPSFLLHDSVLVTGEIDRTNSFELGFPLQEAHDGAGWQPDPLVLDDQAIVIHVRDLGLVVMTGCGHAGVVNTVAYAQRLTGVEKVHAIIGGFHLNGPIFEPLIPKICAAFADWAPGVIMPAHCTGWRATHQLAASFPEAFVHNSVGSRLRMGNRAQVPLTPPPSSQ